MKTFKFIIKGHEYEVEIKKFDDNLAEVEVNGTIYQVEMKRETRTTKTPVIVRTEKPAPRSAHKFKKKIGGSYELRAPLPGNIMQVFVKENDEVKKGDKILAYEAMKMENTLVSEKDGTVKKVLIRPGDSVLEGDLLIEII